MLRLEHDIKIKNGLHLGMMSSRGRRMSGATPIPVLRDQVDSAITLRCLMIPSYLTGSAPQSTKSNQENRILISITISPQIFAKRRLQDSQMGSLFIGTGGLVGNSFSRLNPSVIAIPAFEEFETGQ